MLVLGGGGWDSPSPRSFWCYVPAFDMHETIATDAVWRKGMPLNKERKWGELGRGGLGIWTRQWERREKLLYKQLMHCVCYFLKYKYVHKNISWMMFESNHTFQYVFVKCINSHRKIIENTPLTTPPPLENLLDRCMPFNPKYRHRSKLGLSLGVRVGSVLKHL